MDDAFATLDIEEVLAQSSLQQSKDSSLDARKAAVKQRAQASPKQFR